MAIKYTNAQVAEFKETLFTDLVDGNEVFNEQGFDDWVQMQEAKGNSFPKAFLIKGNALMADVALSNCLPPWFET